MKNYELSLPRSGKTIQIIISVTNISDDMLKNDRFITRHVDASNKDKQEIISIINSVTVPDVLGALSTNVRVGSKKVDNSMEHTMQNFSKGIVGKALDLDEVAKFAELKPEPEKGKESKSSGTVLKNKPIKVINVK